MGKIIWRLGFSSRARWRNSCTARCWSIWYRLFIATLSFFLAEKPPSAHYDRGCESRYFLRINGHPRYSTVMGQLLKPDGMRMPVSGGMRYAPKLSTRSKRKEIKRSEEHTLNSSHANISYAVFCLKKN